MIVSVQNQPAKEKELERCLKVSKLLVPMCDTHVQFWKMTIIIGKKNSYRTLTTVLELLFVHRYMQAGWQMEEILQLLL